MLITTLHNKEPLHSYNIEKNTAMHAPWTRSIPLALRTSDCLADRGVGEPAIDTLGRGEPPQSDNRGGPVGDAALAVAEFGLDENLAERVGCDEEGGSFAEFGLGRGAGVAEVGREGDLAEGLGESEDDLAVTEFCRESGFAVAEGGRADSGDMPLVGEEEREGDSFSEMESGEDALGREWGRGCGGINGSGATRSESGVCAEGAASGSGSDTCSEGGSAVC